MEKNLTAMQELIDRLEFLLNNHPKEPGLLTAIEIAQSLLEKEKMENWEAFLKGTNYYILDEDIPPTRKYFKK